MKAHELAAALLAGPNETVVALPTEADYEITEAYPEAGQIVVDGKRSW